VEGELTGYLGLGSNQGDRLYILRAARSALDGHRDLSVVAASSVYETAPQGEVIDQPDFLNACLRIETALGKEELLDVCKEIERDLGREPGGPRHGPRRIDVDLLLLGDVLSDSERLTLHHPEILSRRFVLEPLLELDPGLTLPDGTRLAGRFDAVSDQRVARVGPL
jgi:2-amino-4-hydroxy-6-hydroxymethyldihydropteridine diphosphokinase